MKITINGGNIWIDADHINPENRMHTDAHVCIYEGKVYLYTHTNRYWHNSSRGNVIELRNSQGKKVKEAGTKEISGYDPIYWGDMERDGRKIPNAVVKFFEELKDIWGAS